MPRPRKCRRVCSLPKNTSFGPVSSTDTENNTIIMSIDEFETIRLIDFEGMLQEECAEKMDVARTTVQRIYNEARLKIAKSLVNGYILKIEGGDVKLCDEAETWCGCKRCHKKKCCEGKDKSSLNNSL
ncbi:DUF134 domain-containing protein [Clostridium omnivorum]|uniref:UPF0251 protein bsdE14_42170 n=1 Tax=Clostridium omnivorum TaxID=1604902 RepID=A0ABQ5NC90_9CLOT|nr:DUF134 domain-containing protein [Clostridium sp. E14]GLC32807.1 hypothetical protein bsdE14_42170 [Clostridium sp. E14]